MRVLLSLAALVLALPVGLFAGGILVLDHVIEVRNPFRLFWELLLAFGWGLPIAVLIFVLLVVATCFRTGQVVVAGALVVANAAALIVVFRSAARPTAVGEVAFLVPAFLSLAIAGYLLWSHGQAARIASPAASSIVCVMGIGVLLAQGPLSRADPSAVGLDAARLREATTLLEQFVADGKIAGAVAAVARNARLAYLQAVGVQDLQTRAPMTERSLFRIYSMTRPITAVAVMMLHEEERFQLDDPIARYIPEFDRVTVVDGPGAAPRKPSRPITVRDLLLHTSGINDRNSEPYRAAQVRSRSIPMATFLDNVIRVPLMEDPGTRFRYGESTTVLGRLVEVWSKQSFEAFLQARVFKPLGMVDTVFVVDESRRPRLATVYTPNTNGGGLIPRETETLPFTERPQLIEGTVGLVSTVPDYLRFCQMLLNRGELGGGRLLTPETVALMTTNGLSAEIMKVRGGSMGWALGNVNVMTDHSSSLSGEYGWDGTAGTIFWNDPARQMVTMLWTQSQPSNPDGIRQKFKAIVQAAIKD